MEFLKGFTVFLEFFAINLCVSLSDSSYFCLFSRFVSVVERCALLERSNTISQSAVNKKF